MQTRKTDNKNTNLVMITRHFKDDISLPTYTTYYAKLYEKGRKTPRLKKIGISTEQVSLAVMRERCRLYIEEHGRFGRSSHTLDQAFYEIYLGELKKKSAKTINDIKRNYEKDIKPHFGQMLMSDIDSPMILSWFNKLTERTEGGANHCLTILKAMFTLCTALGVCKHNPCLPIKKNPDKERARSFTQGELIAFRAALKEAKSRSIYAWSFIMLMFLTGARKGELARATWGDIKGESIVLTDHKTKHKTGQDRYIYLNDLAKAVINNLPVGQDNETILKIKDPRTVWETIMRKANIKDFRMHDLRHNFASAGVNSGLDIIRTAALTGHMSLNSMKRYQRPNIERKLKDTKIIENQLTN